MKRILFIVLGSITFGLGVVGVFLPVLPTTPFLLLSAYFYAKSSKKLYFWLLNHRYFGSYIRAFREEKAIPLHAKVFALSMMWLVILYTSFKVLSNKWYLQVMLIVIASIVTVYILSFKTKPLNKQKEE